MDGRVIGLYERLGMVSSFDQMVFFGWLMTLFTISGVLTYVGFLNVNLLRRGFRKDIFYQAIMSICSGVWAYLIIYVTFFTNKSSIYSSLGNFCVAAFLLSILAYFLRIHLLLDASRWIIRLTTIVLGSLSFWFLMESVLNLFGIYITSSISPNGLDDNILYNKLVIWSHEVLPVGKLTGLISGSTVILNLTYIFFKNFKHRIIDKYLMLGLCITVIVFINESLLILELTFAYYVFPWNPASYFIESLRLTYVSSKEESQKLIKLEKDKVEIENNALFEKNEYVKNLNEQLEIKVTERTKEIQEKSRDIEAILSNISQGIFTISHDLEIDTEYSPYLEVILESREFGGKDIQGVFLNSLNLTQANQRMIEQTLFSLIGFDKMGFDCNKENLPVDVVFSDENGHKDLQLAWDVISNDDNIIEKIIVSVRDMTEVKKLREDMEEQKYEISLITEILQVGIPNFNRFLKSSKEYIDDSININRSDNVNDLFRNLHTIKATCTKYSKVYEKVHASEQYYHRIKTGESDFENDASLAKLNEVKESIQNYQDVFEKYVGFKEDKSGEGQNIIDYVLKAINEDPKYKDIPVEPLEELLSKYGMSYSLEEILKPIIDSIPDIAVKVDKPAPNVNFEGKEVEIDEKFQGLILDVVSHLVRNSMDHGIESNETRLKNNKPENGTITINASFDDSILSMVVEDDGRGLNLAYLEKKGLEEKVIGEGASDEQIASVIFRSGISTAEKVTDISGRGVGMDAVKSFLEKEGGGIEIEFTGDRTSDGFRPFRFKIKLAV